MFQITAKTILLLLLGSSFVGSLHATDKQKTTTTGFLQEITETRIHNGPDRSGKEVYEFRCKGCHGKNTQGAPMPDDYFEWSKRLQTKGLDLLLKHSMEGYNNYLMPPKGGCRDCNQQEVYAAVFYMLQTSGINTKGLRKTVN